MLRTNVVNGEEVHDLAAALIHQAERCKRAGLVEQAIIILDQAWSIARADVPKLADEVAWQIGWLALDRDRFTDAALWFERVGMPPPLEGQWPQIRTTLVRICRTIPAPIITAVPALPALHITSLGHFQIARAEQVLPACRARKALTIFRYLLTRQFYSASKEELMELLWPDAPPAKAAHNLQVAISALRHHLDPVAGSYVLWENGCYRLTPHAAIEDDRLAFQQLCAAADRARQAGPAERAQELYGAALERYSGDYYVDDGDGAWAIAEREHLLTQYLVALERLGNVYQAQGQYEAAVSCYLRLVERDMYREDIVCCLMRCYWKLGRRGAALRQYQRIAAILHTDLGLEPEPATQALQHLIASDADQ